MDKTAANYFSINILSTAKSTGPSNKSCDLGTFTHQNQNLEQAQKSTNNAKIQDKPFWELKNCKQLVTRKFIHKNYQDTNEQLTTIAVNNAQNTNLLQNYISLSATIDLLKGIFTLAPTRHHNSTNRSKTSCPFTTQLFSAQTDRKNNGPILPHPKKCVKSIFHFQKYKHKQMDNEDTSSGEQSTTTKELQKIQPISKDKSRKKKHTEELRNLN
jgi:hypothetical protein